ncbi:AMP-dependent synthetase/ligase [Nocardioides sp. GY 10127]|uniref:AMP-dependent synthetase/ligase n=1 Tax=Nocardioides sp. GY 10127 TaxID=2569762 RepID=UPI0010A82C98|nr:AMP-dependent synthetase/ligase [Nocardioides sp. GY 10127]TIC80943.1 long-chain fatty acid--CoA ligase [Nocardioides sp. GY 10127]
MREYHHPLTLALGSDTDLTQAVLRNAQEAPQAALFSRRGADRAWEDVTSTQFLEEVRAAARGLVAAGVQPGDRVAIMSKTRFEWTLLDYAAWFAGAVTVPVYETSSAEQVTWILSDSGARAVLVETQQHAALVAGIREELPALDHVWTIESGAVAELEHLGRTVADESLERRREQLGPDTVATIVYTSGTTGRPKGCALTHGNFLYELGVATGELEDLFSEEDAATLLFLPLAHVFARIIQVGCVMSRARLGHSPDVKNLMADLAEFRPTFILAVPRVFEKVFNGASQKAYSEGRGAIFARAAATAIAYSESLDHGGPGLRLRLTHALFDRLVYTKLRTALGGRCRYAISGGAPLGERLSHFFRGLGLTVLEGYGLTETTAALAANLPGAIRIGTVGRPFQGTSVKVADDGELLWRGDQVFSGYWHNAEATREVLDADGWFRSGDIGEIDAEGFVRITGRKKEIIVTAGGKNVAPAVLEDRLRQHPLIDQCVVVGDQKPFIAALITLDRESLPRWAADHGKRPDPDSLVADPELHAELQGAVDEANLAVSHAESIRKFAVLADEWTEEGGQLTPSMKLKRAVVMREVHRDVEELYR